MGQKGFFDVERRLEAISAKGDPLETIKKIVPWEDFRADIEGVTETKPEERKSNAGRKPYDAILKFKIVVLQSLHNLSDEQTEYLTRFGRHLEAAGYIARGGQIIDATIVPEDTAKLIEQNSNWTTSCRISESNRSTPLPSYFISKRNLISRFHCLSTIPSWTF